MSRELVDTVVRHRVGPGGGVVVPDRVDAIVGEDDGEAGASAYIGVKNGEKRSIVVTWKMTEGNNFKQSIHFIVTFPQKSHTESFTF